MNEKYSSRLPVLLCVGDAVSQVFFFFCCYFFFQEYTVRPLYIRCLFVGFVELGRRCQKLSLGL